MARTNQTCRRHHKRDTKDVDRVGNREGIPSPFRREAGIENSFSAHLVFSDHFWEQFSRDIIPSDSDSSQRIIT